MAREAYEAQRKAYTDSLLTTAIAAFTRGPRCSSAYLSP